MSKTPTCLVGDAKKERDGALQRNRIFFYNFADLITTLKTDAFGAETLCPTLSG
jgi:hypothetical protein